MKALLGVVGLLAVLATVSLLAKKQAVPDQGQAVHTLPQQVKTQVEASLQQVRPVPEDK